VSRRQLVVLGFSARGIEEWVRTGRLIPLHRGVYAVGHDRLTSQGRWLAAVIACGRGAVLSHLAAAQLWEIRQSSAAVTDVTVPSRAGRISRRGIRIHRSGRLAEEQTTTRHGIPVTTVARTLLDLADVIDDQALRRTVTEAEYRNLFDLTTLNAVVQANPGRRNAKLMRAVDAAGHLTRSPLEDRFLAFKERWGVQEPETNVWLDGYEVDFLWRRVGLVVELDGLEEHGTRAAVRRDRKRDRELRRAGFRTKRLTDDALDAEQEVLRDLGEAGVRVAANP
jgi:very-short-patch-repair endonuclease